MSNRTLVELNHDYSPTLNSEALYEWACKMWHYMASGDPKYLPQGVTFIRMRHHSEPEFDVKHVIIRTGEYAACFGESFQNHAQFKCSCGVVGCESCMKDHLFKLHINDCEVGIRE